MKAVSRNECKRAPLCGPHIEVFCPKFAARSTKQFRYTNLYILTSLNDNLSSHLHMPLAAPDGTKKFECSRLARREFHHGAVGGDVLIDPEVGNDQPMLHVGIMDDEANQLAWLGGDSIRIPRILPHTDVDGPFRHAVDHFRTGRRKIPRVPIFARYRYGRGILDRDSFFFTHIALIRLKFFFRFICITRRWRTNRRLLRKLYRLTGVL